MAAPALQGVAVLTLAEARALVSELTSGWSGPLADSTIVQSYIDAATAVVEGIVGPVVIQSASFSWDGGTAFLPLPWPILDTYDIVLTESGVTLTKNVDYYYDSANAVILGGQPPNGTRWFTTGYDNLKLTAWVGRDINVTPVPAPIKRAVAEEFRVAWQNTQQGVSRSSWGGETNQQDYPPGGYAAPHSVYELAQFTQHIPGFA